MEYIGITYKLVDLVPKLNILHSSSESPSFSMIILLYLLS